MKTLRSPLHLGQRVTDVYDPAHCSLYLPIHNGDFRDWAKSGLACTSSSITWANTKWGQAPSFDGESSEVNCGQDASIDIADKNTLFMLLQFSSWKNNGVVWRKGSDSNNRIHLICNTSTKLELQIYNNSIQQVSIESDTIIINRPYEVIIRVDETAQICEFYLDKKLQGEDTGFTLPDTSGEDLVLGAN